MAAKRIYKDADQDIEVTMLSFQSVDEKNTTAGSTVFVVKYGGQERLYTTPQAFMRDLAEGIRYRDITAEVGYGIVYEMSDAIVVREQAEARKYRR